MYSVLMSLPACPVIWQANFFRQGHYQQALLQLTEFPASPFSLLKQPHQVMPCFSFAVQSASNPPSSAMVSPRTLLLLQAADHKAGEPFSTHVKLQLLPKSIPMASCCAEEMLISSSPSVLDYVQTPPTPLHLFDEEGGLGGRRTYIIIFVYKCA